MHGFKRGDRVRPKNREDYRFASGTLVSVGDFSAMIRRDDGRPVVRLTSEIELDDGENYPEDAA